MAQENPLAKYDKYRVSGSGEDPLKKYDKYRIEPTTEPVEPVETELTAASTEPEGESWWDWATRSRLPEASMPDFLVESEHPMYKPARIAAGLGIEAYDQLIRPLASPFGAAAAVAGGPVIRGSLGVLSKVPGIKKIGSLLNKEILPGEAPSFAKKAAETLAPKSKATTPVDTPEIVPPVTASEPTPLDKFRLALEENKPLSKEQRKLLTVERAEKFGEARAIDVTDAESAKHFMSKFKDEHSKLSNEPLKLEQDDVNGLIKMIGEAHKAGKVDIPEQAQAITAFNRLLEGAALQKNEIETLSRIFGPEVMAKVPKGTSVRDWIMSNVSIPKALFSALDVGWPLRQGIQRAGSANWNRAVWDSFKAYSSENKSKEIIEEIKKIPRFDFWRSNGLEIYDNIKTTGLEQSINSRVQNFLPVRMGNRAFNAGISKLRLQDANDLFDDYSRMYKSAIDLAKSNTNKAMREQLLKEAEIHNPENSFVAKSIANQVNTGTGYGSIGKLKAIAEELNATVFSPALISSRLRSIHRVLNPVSYVNKDPVQRKYALKQLLSLTSAIVSLGTLLKSAGAEVGLNPTSSDFLTAKFGDTRVDLTGGFRGYFTAPAKIMSGISTSTRTGKENVLNSGRFGGQTKFDVLENFAIGKSSPIASLVISYLRGIEPTGEKTEFGFPETSREGLDFEGTTKDVFGNTATKMAIPGIIQTLYEISEEDPDLLPLMIPAMMGSNVSVYDDNRMFADRMRRR